MFLEISSLIWFNDSHQKPIVTLLELPPRPGEAPSITPLLTLPATYKPRLHPYASLERVAGRVLDRIVGVVWWVLILLGAGSGIVGIFNFLVGIGALTWWRGVREQPSVSNGSV